MTFQRSGLALAAGMVAVLLGGPSVAFPCSCLESGSACAAASGSSAIFVGTAAAVQTGVRLRYRFDVEEALQGVDGKTVEVTTQPDTAACGYPFKVGTKYLVYATGEPGSYAVSLCSRTGPLEARRNDVDLLRRAPGVVQPRLFGMVYREQLRLSGRPFDLESVGGIPGIGVSATGPGGTREARTDAEGRFRIDDVAPGRYDVTLELPDGDEILFGEPIVANVDRCAGEVSIAVTRVPLRGTFRPAPGETIPGRIMLVVTPVGADGRPANTRSAMAMPEQDGSWSLPGLPAGKYVISVGAVGVPTPQMPYAATWYQNAPAPETATVLEVSDAQPLSVEFQLPARLPEISLAGTTITSEGRPLGKVSVTLFDADAVTGFPDASHATSDENGRFTITGLAGRRYRIEGRELRPGGGRSGMIDVTLEMIRTGITLTVKP